MQIRVSVRGDETRTWTGKAGMSSRRTLTMLDLDPNKPMIKTFPCVDERLDARVPDLTGKIGTFFVKDIRTDFGRLELLGEFVADDAKAAQKAA